MLNTRKSRRRSEVFKSRFRDGSVDFPLRQYLRCREEFFSGIVHAILLTAFIFALAYFAKTLWELFAVHGANLSPWYRLGAIVGMAVAITFVGLRLVLKIRALREVRQEMHYLKSQFPTARPSK